MTLMPFPICSNLAFQSVLSNSLLNSIKFLTSSPSIVKMEVQYTSVGCQEDQMNGYKLLRTWCLVQDKHCISV